MTVQCCIDCSFDEETFLQCINHHALPLLAAGRKIVGRDDQPTVKVLTRPLLAWLCHYSHLLESTLDDFGAQQNSRFSGLRESTFTVHWLSRILNELLHLSIRLDSYQLVYESREPLRSGVSAAMDKLRWILCESLQYLGAHGVLADFQWPTDQYDRLFHLGPVDGRFLGRLPRDYQNGGENGRRDECCKSHIVHMATLLLRAVDDPAFHQNCCPTAKQFVDRLTGHSANPCSEEKLRPVADRMYYLRSLYDSFISNTALEQCDEDLKPLRGSIAAMYHLMTVVADLSHYLEHFAVKAEDDGRERCEKLCPLLNDALQMAALILREAEPLGRRLIDRYGHRGEIVVRAPLYKGFHHRPTHRLAIIARHYRTSLIAEINGVCYDASVPLALTMANGYLDCQKKEWLDGQLQKYPQLLCGPLDGDAESLAERIQEIVFFLEKQGELELTAKSIYLRKDLSLSPGGSFRNLLFDEFTHLLGTGQINIDLEIPIRYRGDRRALADVEKLAMQYNYGEDNRGNDVPLPSELRYIWGERG